jgi:hypothetical protein
MGELRLDMVVENSVILELKSVERADLLFEAQLAHVLTPKRQQNRSPDKL